MDVDYYSWLTKAVAGKDAPARDQIYKDAYSLIKRSHLERETAASHVAALEDAVRRIEDDIATEAANAVLGFPVQVALFVVNKIGAESYYYIRKFNYNGKLNL